MNFTTRLNHILEAMGTATYQIPKAAYHLMADFYLIQLLEAHQLAAHSNRAEKLQYELESVKQTLVPFLREHLLDCAGYSIVCELRHVFDSCFMPGDPHTYAAKEDKYSAQRQEKSQLLLDSGCSPRLLELLISHSDNGDQPDRTQLNETDRHQAVSAGLSIFQEDGPVTWYTGYGGPPWEQACKSWLSLYNAKRMNDTIIYVDKLYSTEHNNGSLLDKNPEYKGTWVKQLLDLKFKANDPEELLPYVSPFMKKLGRMWLVQATGRGWSGSDRSHRFGPDYLKTFYQKLSSRLSNRFTCKIDNQRNTVSISHNNTFIAIVSVTKYGVYIDDYINDSVSIPTNDRHLIDKVERIIESSYNDVGQTNQ